MIIDLICYVWLLSMLIWISRVKPLAPIKLELGGVELPGTILKSKTSLSSRVGLLNSPHLNPGFGLLLTGTKSVHTVGMHFAIDLVFTDELFRVLGFEKNVPPGRKKITGPKGTRFIVELGNGTIDTYWRDIKMYAEIGVKE
jgi:uncharacterized protein